MARDGRSAPAAGHGNLTSRLQAALTLSEVERAYLETAKTAVMARGVGMYRLHPDSYETQSIAADVDQQLLDDYEAYGRADDPVLRYVIENGRSVDSTRATRPAEWIESAACHVLGQVGLFHSLEAPIIVQGDLRGTINFARYESDPPFTPGDLRTASSMSEQVGLAMERALRFEEVDTRRSTLESVLNRLPQAIVVTGLDARLLFANRAAQATSRGRASLAIRAESAIAEALTLFRDEGRRVSITRVADAGSVGLRVRTTRIGPDDGGAALSFIFDGPVEQASTLPDWELLSQREREIARFVSQGMTTRQIAEQAFVTDNTVKQHLKRIFAKVDVHNRAELMQRIWASRPPSLDEEDA